MVTALVSLLTGKKVRGHLAMTGEISLRGLVLPVGGIKEKVIAAKSAGIKQVILPTRNEKDLEDVSDPVREALKFHFVDDLAQVLDLVFGDGIKNRPVVESHEEDEEKAADDSVAFVIGDPDDPKSSPEQPRWVMVDVRGLAALDTTVSLAELKANPKLAAMKVVQKGQRLSIQPVDESEYFEVLSMAGAKDP